jgi:hypothetical protein
MKSHSRKTLLRFLLPIVAALGLAMVTPSTARAIPAFAESFGVDGSGDPVGYYGIGSDLPTSIAAMPDGGVVVAGKISLTDTRETGHTENNNIDGLVRFAADGTIIWKKVLRATNNFTSEANFFHIRIVSDSQGNIYLVSKLNHRDGSGPDYTYAAKLGSDGTIAWQKILVENSTPYNGISLAPNGKLVLTGNFLTIVDAGSGSVELNKPYQYSNNTSADSQGGSGSKDGTKYLFCTSDNGMTVYIVDTAGKVLASRTFFNASSGHGASASIPTADGDWLILSGDVIRKVGLDQGHIVTRFERIFNYTEGSGSFQTVVQMADGSYLLGGPIGANTGQGYGTPSPAKAGLFRMDAQGNLTGAYALGGQNPEAAYDPQGLSPGRCTAVVTTDGGYAFATDTLSYRFQSDERKRDWWIGKTDTAGRIHGFKGVMLDVTAKCSFAPFTDDSSTPAVVLDSSIGYPISSAAGLSISTAEAPGLLRIQAAPPRITSSKTAEAVVGQHFSYHINASFFDAGVTLTYTATGLPQYFTFDPATGVISGVPPVGSETTTPILITLGATDGSFSTAPVTLALTIGDGIPVLTVKDTGIPGGAAVGDRVLSFVVKYPGKKAARDLFIEVNEAGTWHVLPDAMDGHMSYDVLNDQYILNSTNYPLGANVSFRARVTIPGNDPPVLSNVVGPINLAGTKQRAGQTVFHLNRNGVRADFDFIAEQKAAVAGVSLRIQSSTTPAEEGSWEDLRIYGGAPMKSEGGNRFSYLSVTNNPIPLGENIYYRAVASASGLTDSLSNIIGPYTLSGNAPPKVTLKLPAPSGANNGTPEHPIIINADATGVATFTIDAQATAVGRTLQRVSLLVDGDVIRTLTPAAGTVSTDYQASYNAGIGTHLIEAIAIDDLGTIARAGTYPLYVNIYPSANAAKAMSSGGGDTAAVFNPSKVFTVASSGGSWDNPATWIDQRGNHGVPSDIDFVILGSSTVKLPADSNAKAGSLSMNGGHIVGPGYLEVHTTLAVAGGSFDSDVTIKIVPNAVAEFTNSSDIPFDGVFLNFGALKLHGARGLLNMKTFLNLGVLVLQDSLVTSDSVAAGLPLDPRTISGSAIDIGNVKVSGIQIENVVSNDGNSLIGKVKLISQDGGTLIQRGTGSILSEQGAGVISTDSAGVISTDGAGLISQDGGTLITNDGGTLITNDGGTLVGNSGGTIRGNIPGRANLSSNVKAETTPPGITLSTGNLDVTGINLVGPVTINGGILTGSGLIVGSVTNNSGYIAPGHSAGTLAITGNYTQGAGGTMIIEAAGGEAGQFDQVQIGGTASLGGKLDLRTINGYVPLANDPFNPLGYKSVSGSFSSVSSNAQVTLNASGIISVIDPAKPNPSSGQPVNIATRMSVQTGDNVLIAGFIVTGPSGSTKKVLIRGMGPSLAQFGVAGTLSDPFLELHKPDGSVVSNDNWQQGDTSQIPNGFAPSDSRESVLVATLTPGNYSAVVKGAHGETGVGIAEVYDLESASPAKLANLSTRGFINTGDDVMIGGFIIGGNEPAKILVRAIGPTLTDFGIQGALADPTLELHDSNGSTINNDDWRETQEGEIIATTIPPDKDREPAIIATLVPGNYTAVVRGKNNTTGIGLVEAYNLQ